MPVVGENVCANPNFTVTDFDGLPTVPLWWTVDYSWEPYLAVGAHGLTSGEITIDDGGIDGIHYYVETNVGMVDPALNLYPGLLYAGPGFDAAPGDEWSISFDFQWAKPDDITGNDHKVIDGNGTAEIFVRYGITVWNDTTQHWDAWYAQLPIVPIPLPDNLSGLNGEDGTPASYVAAFTIPANFPVATLQFAICTTPNFYTLDQLEDPDYPSNKMGGMSLRVNNVDLHLVSPSGVVSAAGSSPGDSFYSFWPTPRYAAGSPDGFNVDLEWDQFQLTSAPEQIVMTPWPNSGDTAYAQNPGMYAATYIIQGPPGEFAISSFPSDFEAWFARTGSRDVQPGDSRVVDMPPTDTVPPRLGVWQFPFDYVSTMCGPHRVALLGFAYLCTPQYEVASRGFFGGIGYGYNDGGFISCVHPTVRWLRQGEGLIPAFGGPQIFSYYLACGGLHVWQRI